MKNKNLCPLLYSFFVSFCILLFTSKNSFFYPINDWVDANAFFTVGKSLFNGVIPYRDIFEQKGIVLYLIYGIGYIFSNKSFLGVFFLEVIADGIFLYSLYKIFVLFVDKKIAFFLIPVLWSIITTSTSFVHGGSCEEFILPFIGYTLYYYFKHFHGLPLRNREMAWLGASASFVFLIKYTILGFWIGVGLFLFLHFLIEKEYKNAFKFCLYFALGFLIPLFLALIYFLITSSLKSFIECYFIVNMTAYNETSTTFLSKIGKIIIGYFGSLHSNGHFIFGAIISIPICLFFMKSKKYFKFSILGILLITITLLLWGLKFYRYYIFPSLAFLVFPFVFIGLMLSKVQKRFSPKEFPISLICFSLALSIFLAYQNANYKNMLFMPKSEVFLFKYADYIARYDNPTLLNMGYLDAGLYTTTGIVPNTRFFEVQNISYESFPDNLDDMRYNVEHQNVQFILFYTRRDMAYVEKNYSYIFDSYKLVFDDEYYFENEKYNAFLFELDN